MSNKDAWIPCDRYGHPIYNEDKVKEDQAKKDLYCNCEEPDVYRTGFHRIRYDFCKKCRKEKI